jgi:hypothetical protein
MAKGVLLGVALPLAVAGGLVGVATAFRAPAAPWEPVGPGLELATMPWRAPGEGRFTRLVLLRVNPAEHHLALDLALTPDFRHAAWSVDRAPREAVAAFNAGQFNWIVPWGWTVREGRELRPPGVGPLSMAVVEDSAGRLHFVPPDSIDTVRRAGGIRTAIQSYPALLTGDGEIPAPLTMPDRGVATGHRDARLALCQLHDRRLLVLLTRFDGLGELGQGIPFGLTLGETAELLRAQGCRRAVALDGGISAQLLVRGADGEERAWRGWRRVPAGLYLEPR